MMGNNVPEVFVPMGVRAGVLSDLLRWVVWAMTRKGKVVNSSNHTIADRHQPGEVVQAELGL